MCSRLGFVVLSDVLNAKPERSPLTAFGNVRVGPPAMSFIHSMFSPTAFLLVENINNIDKRNRS